MQTLLKLPDDGSRIHIEQVTKTAFHVTRIYPVRSQVPFVQFRCGVSKMNAFRDEWKAEGFIDADVYMQQLREGAAV